MLPIEEALTLAVLHSLAISKQQTTISQCTRLPYRPTPSAGGAPGTWRRASACLLLLPTACCRSVPLLNVGPEGLEVLVQIAAEEYVEVFVAA